jgi:hypothetical protein
MKLRSGVTSIQRHSPAAARSSTRTMRQRKTEWSNRRPAISAGEVSGARGTAATSTSEPLVQCGLDSRLNLRKLGSQNPVIFGCQMGQNRRAGALAVAYGGICRWLTKR